MGAAGSGKTTVGRALADGLGWPFVDADDLHSPSNIARMRRGVALTDADRAPWLAAVHDRIARAIDRRERLVVACSALRQAYRDVLRGRLRTIRFVYLRASEPVLRARLEHRRGHFVDETLLASQLATLEEPVDALTVEAALPVERVVEIVRVELGL